MEKNCIKIRHLIALILMLSNIYFQEALANSECIGFYNVRPKKMRVYIGNGGYSEPPSSGTATEVFFYLIANKDPSRYDTIIKKPNADELLPLLSETIENDPGLLKDRFIGVLNRHNPDEILFNYKKLNNGDLYPFKILSNKQRGHLEALNFKADEQRKAELDHTNVTVVGDGIEARALQELNIKGISATSIDIDYSRNIIQLIPVSAELKQHLKKGDVRKLSQIRTQQKFILAKDLLDSLVSNEDRVKALNEISKALALGGEARLTFSGKDSENLVRSLKIMSDAVGSDQGIKFLIEPSQVAERSMVLVIQKHSVSKSSSIKPGGPFATIRESSAEFLVAAKRAVGVASKGNFNLSPEVQEKFLFLLLKITFFKDMKITPDSNFDRALLNFFRAELLPLIQVGNYKDLLAKLSTFELVGQRIRVKNEETTFYFFDERQSPEHRFRIITRYLRDNGFGCESNCRVEYPLIPIENDFNTKRIPDDPFINNIYKLHPIKDYLSNDRLR